MANKIKKIIKRIKANLKNFLKSIVISFEKKKWKNY